MTDDVQKLKKENAKLLKYVQILTKRATRNSDADRDESVCGCKTPELVPNTSGAIGNNFLCYSCLGWARSKETKPAVSTPHCDHVMIDLETLDTAPTAALVSIGAYVFKGPNMGEKIYITVKAETCVSIGMTVSKETVAFWQEQPEDVRKVLTCKDAVDINTALDQLSNFLLSTEDVHVWGNGASFDNAMLENAYTASGKEIPWEFWNNRCYRTAMADVEERPERVGSLHHALDDALTQAKHILKHRPNRVF